MSEIKEALTLSPMTCEALAEYLGWPVETVQRTVTRQALPVVGRYFGRDVYGLPEGRFTMAKASPGAVSSAVLRVLRGAAPDMLRTQEIAQATPYQYRSVHNALTSLLEAGQVQRKRQHPAVTWGIRE